MVNAKPLFTGIVAVVSLLIANNALAGTSYATQPATEITDHSAVLNGYAQSTVGLGGEFFYYGLTTSYGASGAGSPQGVPGAVSMPVSGLACGTTYHFKFTGTPYGTTLQGSDLTFTTLPCATITGFTGLFAPANWQSGSNAPANLVNTSGAPNSVTLSNYAPWAVSGATFTYANAPSNGTVTFTYSLSGVTPACPAAYVVGNTPTLLTNNNGGQSISFAVTTGASFGFALNGQDLPTDFGCHSNGRLITFTVSNFVFTPN
jgi:hypothetical protein